MMDRPNTPVPDELYAVRQQIKQLEEREAALKQILLSDPETRTGASYLAEIKEVTQNSTDWKELKACHPNIVDEFTYPRMITRVVLFGITEDGEIIPARRMR